MPVRLGLVVFVALLLTACTSTLIPSATPRATPLASPSSTPNASPTSPTIGPGAALAVRGDGQLDCADAFYGGCSGALLLQPFEAGPLPTQLDHAAPIQFTTERKSLSESDIVGPVTGAPARIAVGRWRVGLGRIISSDAGTCDSPCTSPYFPTDTGLLCADEFEVTPLTDEVDVLGHFGDECSIDVQLEPQASTSPLPTALLQIRGRGSVSCIDYEGCGAALILDPGIHDLGADWNPNDWDATFDVERVSSAKAQLLGSVSGAPHQIAIGSWTIGLVHVRISDVPTCANPCVSPIPNYYGTVLCSRVVQVDEGARSVDIEAVFDEPCRIDVQMDASTLP